MQTATLKNGTVLDISGVKNPKRLKFEIEAEVSARGFFKWGYSMYWPNGELAYSHYPTTIYCYNSNGRRTHRFKLKSWKNN
jgi:hypothetical protein